MELPVELLRTIGQLHQRRGPFEVAPELAATFVDVAKRFKLIERELQFVVLDEVTVRRETREVRVTRLP